MNVLDTVDKLAADLTLLSAAIKPESQESLMKKFRLEFNYNSNHMEGNTLTYTETELLLLFDDTAGSHNMREYEEMKAHDVAYHLVQQWAKEPEAPLTEQNIKNLNQIILVRPFWKDAITPDRQQTKKLINIGNYKEQPNSVLLSNGEMFHYASPTDTPILMGELIEWYRSEEGTTHPVTLAAMLHYKFVRIHPFDDGNGRIARLLMNYVLLKNGYPPVIIKSNDKSNYLKAIHLADIGDYSAFIAYVAEQLVWSLETAIKAHRNESIEEPDDVDKRIVLFKKAVSKTDVVTIKQSYFSVNQVLEHSIIPLLVILDQKLTQLEDLFLDSARTIRFNEGGLKYSIGDEGKSSMNIAEKWIEKRINRPEEGFETKTVSLFEYSFQLKGYKKSLSLQYVNVNVVFQFYEFDYTVRLNNNHNEEKRIGYSEVFTREFITNIVAKLVDKVIEELSSANK